VALAVVAALTLASRWAPPMLVVVLAGVTGWLLGA
jgi:chromate transport protein ChrA